MVRMSIPSKRARLLTLSMLLFRAAAIRKGVAPAAASSRSLSISAGFHEDFIRRKLISPNALGRNKFTYCGALVRRGVDLPPDSGLIPRASRGSSGPSRRLIAGGLAQACAVIRYGHYCLPNCLTLWPPEETTACRRVCSYSNLAAGGIRNSRSAKNTPVLTFTRSLRALEAQHPAGSCLK
jgi:hypothetical protein